MANPTPDYLAVVQAALETCDRFMRTGIVDHAMLTIYQAAPAIADLRREVERLQGIERGWRDALNKIESAQAARIATLEAELAQARAAAPITDDLHPDGCHTTATAAFRDCSGDGHHECRTCTRFDEAARAKRIGEF